MLHLRLLPAALLAGLALAVFAVAGSSHTAEANDCDGAPDIAIGNVDDEMLRLAGLEPSDLEIEIRLFEDGGAALVVNTPDTAGSGQKVWIDPADPQETIPEVLGGPTFPTFCSPAVEMHPLTDIDGDGVPNRDDECPDLAGDPPSGCPRAA